MANNNDISDLLSSPLLMINHAGSEIDNSVPKKNFVKEDYCTGITKVRTSGSPALTKKRKATDINRMALSSTSTRQRQNDNSNNRKTSSSDDADNELMRKKKKISASLTVSVSTLVSVSVSVYWYWYRYLCWHQMQQ